MNGILVLHRKDKVGVIKMEDKVWVLIKELETKKKDYENCFSSSEAKLIKEWNKTIDECISTAKMYV